MYQPFEITNVALTTVSVLGSLKNEFRKQDTEYLTSYQVIRACPLRCMS